MKRPYCFRRGEIVFHPDEPGLIWSFPDPMDKGVVDSMRALRHAVYPEAGPMPERVLVKTADLEAALNFARAYMHLCVYPLGTKHVCRQLADVRRVLRQEARGE